MTATFTPLMRCDKEEPARIDRGGRPLTGALMVNRLGETRPGPFRLSW